MTWLIGISRNSRSSDSSLSKYGIHVTSQPTYDIYTDNRKEMNKIKYIFIKKQLSYIYFRFTRYFYNLKNDRKTNFLYCGTKHFEIVT